MAVGDPPARLEKCALVNRLGGVLVSAVHDRSVIAAGVSLGEGSAVMAGAVINPASSIGRGCIVNTAAVIEHDCLVGDFVNIGPGCRLAGGVSIRRLAVLGLDSMVIPGKKIGRRCVIGAGAVVISDIPDYSVAVGVPARVIKHALPV